MTVQATPNPVQDVLGRLASDPNLDPDFSAAVAPPAAAPATPGSVGDLLAELRNVIDAREQLARRDAELSKVKQDLERQLVAYHEAHGVESLAGAGLSVGFDDSAMRVKYDPERFNDIFRWAAETGNAHVIQRRFTEKAVVDLVKAGVPLPEGLSLESYTRLNVRRK